MTYSICIATYKRPELLGLLLDSLFAQELTDKINLEIIIVDNDPVNSGKPVFDKFSNTEKIPLFYFSQHVKNISLTRNKAVQNARGDYLFFIDDDEIASPSWVRLMIKTMEDFNADAVFGRVLCHFPESTPDWIKKSYIFNRPSPPTGTPTFAPRTGNCLIKTSVINKIEGPFDPAYGVTGGEDTHLFGKLRRSGCIFINCYEAWVSEFQPPSRSRTSYMLNRAFFTGNLATRRSIEFSSSSRIFKRIKFLLKSTFFLIVSSILVIIFLPSNHYRIYWASKVASNFGHILATFNIKINAYR